MTVFFDKTRGRWRYDFQVGGMRHAQECRDATGVAVTSRRGATDAEAEAKRIARMVPKLARAGDLTLAEVMNALSDGWAARAGWRERQKMVKEVLDFFGPATPMRAIDGSRIQDYVTFAQNQPIMVWIGGPISEPGALARRWSPHPAGKTRSPARVNRYLPLLRAAFDRAHNTRDALTGARAVDDIPAIKDLAETKRKARPVPEAALQRLHDLLPAHVIDGMVVTLYFGFRQGEAFGLTKDQVDWQASGVRLFAEHVKDAEDVFLPASQVALGYLRCLAIEADARRVRHLITWRPAKTAHARGDALRWRPIKSPKSAWKTAMKVIETEFGRRWRWHDVRAAFITHVAMTSGPLAAQRMARHSDFSTTQGYIEVADEVMRAAAERATDRPAFGLIRGGKS